MGKSDLDVDCLYLLGSQLTRAFGGFQESRTEPELDNNSALVEFWGMSADLGNELEAYKKLVPATRYWMTQPTPGGQVQLDY